MRLYQIVSLVFLEVVTQYVDWQFGNIQDFDFSFVQNYDTVRKSIPKYSISADWKL